MEGDLLLQTAMCGIFFSVRIDNGETSDFTDLFRRLQIANAARGPDYQGLHKAYISQSTPSSRQLEPEILVLEFYASELRLRGEVPVIQPHEKDGDVLCWNGEIFDGMEVTPQENDGNVLFDKLRTLETMEQVRDIFGSIEGPYAFVYYQSTTQKLFFARDPLGRRSLLIHKPTEATPYALIASVSAGTDLGYNFAELCTDRIYCLDLSQVECTSQEQFESCLVCIPRQSTSSPFCNPFAEPTRINPSLPQSDEPSLVDLSQIPEHLVSPVDDFIYHLDRSVMLRVRDIPRRSPTTKEARVAVLFSGGIDSTIITYLAHRHIPLDEPIDLLNVAFENPRKMRIQSGEKPSGTSKKRGKLRQQSQKSIQQETSNTYNVPDRLTGLQELEELRCLCPERVWNFVEINVPYEESQAARETVESLMSPGRTVMDLSLALALYFASRGIGQVRDSVGAELVPYTSNARVLLSGLGSDELLGGYGRHRTAYTTGGWQSVIEELQLEIDRIPTRNMGRDDRVVSSHGKETRHPFLSLTVLDFLARLPLNHKMDPRLEAGFGDKMLLRLAAWKLGLREASKRKKRAMQFGSHSARMDGERRGDTPLE